MGQETEDSNQINGAVSEAVEPLHTSTWVGALTPEHLSAHSRIVKEHTLEFARHVASPLGTSRCKSPP